MALQVILDHTGIEALFEALLKDGYRLVGPTLRDGAIVLDDIAETADLPVGWTDEQHAGIYGVQRRTDDCLFGFVVGPHSWKKFLHPPEEIIWSSDPKSQPSNERFAFVGVRPCDLAAIERFDDVMMGEFTDNTYAERRRDAFVIAVNCTEPGGTCFCTSMGTGPGAQQGFDLAVTEILDDHGHEFVVSVGSDVGQAVIQRVPHRPATEADSTKEGQLIDQAARSMGRALDTTDIKDLLYRNAESDRWDVIARRCLSCSNCTMVCPTCFCTDVDDSLSLTGEATRTRRWVSCFGIDFSYIHGGPLRSSGAARYRQWITHKFAAWIDQFGTSGCVGCGRCITWCPPAIDVTEEVFALRKEEQSAHA